MATQSSTVRTSYLETSTRSVSKFLTWPQRILPWSSVQIPTKKTPSNPLREKEGAVDKRLSSKVTRQKDHETGNSFSPMMKTSSSVFKFCCSNENFAPKLQDRQAILICDGEAFLLNSTDGISTVKTATACLNSFIGRKQFQELFSVVSTPNKKATHMWEWRAPTLISCSVCSTSYFSWKDITFSLTPKQKIISHW